MTVRVPSRYNISVPLRNGRALVYNSLSGAFALWESHERETFDKIAAGEQGEHDDKVLEDLAKGGYIVSETIDELEYLRHDYNMKRFDRGQITLTIAPTMACNFGCDYCFQGQDKPNDTMRPDVQDAIVAMVRNNIPSMRSLGVAWYGGEPLMRFKVIEEMSDRLIEVAKLRGIKYSAMIVTNGFLLNAEVARSLYQRKVTIVQVTLDGTPEHHDARRHLLNKRGTFERLVENLKDAATAVPNMMFSIRVNIDERNHKDIHRLIDLLVEAGLGNRRNVKMYFAPVEAMTEGCHAVEGHTMTKAVYGKLEADLIRHGYEVGLCQLPYPPKYHGTCAAVKPGGFVILPNGDVHKCWDTVSWPDKRVGDMFHLEELSKSSMVMRWLKWTPFDNETCKNCKLLPNCAGACAYKFVHSSETRGEAAVLPCPSWKYNMKERLVHRALGRKLITEADYDPAEIKTVPTELCADVHIDGGKPLPDEMQKFYDEQQAPKKFKLTVIQ